MVKDSEIKEIVLNPAYCTENDFRSLYNRGISVRWMEEDERSDNDIVYLIMDG